VGDKPETIFSYPVSAESQDVRLDVFLSAQSVGLSRSRIQTLIGRGNVKVNDIPSKSSYKLKAGDRVVLTVPAPPPESLKPEAVNFTILYEDKAIIVFNKPAGVVVHPGPGHATGTVVHGLIRHCKRLSGIGGLMRPGIVHRLDKDTSGLMVAAKSDDVHAHLAAQFRSGTIQKEYVALVHGRIAGDKGKIDLPVARHPKRRKEMSVAKSGGRRALTLWQKMAEFQSGFCLLSIATKTGRTHQIRVHLSHIGHPVVGDPVYGYGRNWWKRHPLRKKGAVPNVERQMLHARRLGFVHPHAGRYLEFEAPLPEDMNHAVSALRSAEGRIQGDKDLDINKKSHII
jgi:23S rRNA pseudouridine1911/1915/1917 synthase